MDNAEPEITDSPQNSNVSVTNDDQVLASLDNNELSFMDRDKSVFKVPIIRKGNQQTCANRKATKSGILTNFSTMDNESERDFSDLQLMPKQVCQLQL